MHKIHDAPCSVVLAWACMADARIFPIVITWWIYRPWSKQYKKGNEHFALYNLYGTIFIVFPYYIVVVVELKKMYISLLLFTSTKMEKPVNILCFMQSYYSMNYKYKCLSTPQSRTNNATELDRLHLRWEWLL